MSTLIEIRRAQGKSQAKIAHWATTQTSCIRAIEYGIGHAFRKGQDWSTFPNHDFLASLSVVLDLSIESVINSYRQSARLGHRQILYADELPAEKLFDLFAKRSLTNDDVAQMADIDIQRLSLIAHGSVEPSAGQVSRLACALRMRVLTVEVVLWAARYRRQPRTIS